MGQCNAVTKHADLSGYFSQDSALLNVHNSHFYELIYYTLPFLEDIYQTETVSGQNKSFLEWELKIFWM